jgi:hypothetical protein
LLTLSVAAFSAAAHASLPLLDARDLANSSFSAKEAELAGVRQRLSVCMSGQSSQRTDLDRQLGDKARAADKVSIVSRKLDLVVMLIDGLAAKRAEWESEVSSHAEASAHAVGDSVTAAAFSSYCGPLPGYLRQKFIEDVVIPDSRRRGFPITASLNVAAACCGFSSGSTANDTNAGISQSSSLIMAALSSGHTVLAIDPDGVVLDWLRRAEHDRLPREVSTSAASPKLDQQLAFCAAEGSANNGVAVATSAPYFIRLCRPHSCR